MRARHVPICPRPLAALRRRALFPLPLGGDVAVVRDSGLGRGPCVCVWSPLGRGRVCVWSPSGPGPSCADAALLGAQGSLPSAFLSVLRQRLGILCGLKRTHLFIWLPQVLTAVHRILQCCVAGTRAPCPAACGGPGPQPATVPCTGRTLSLDHQGVPWWDV